MTEDSRCSEWQYKSRLISNRLWWSDNLWPCDIWREERDDSQEEKEDKEVKDIIKSSVRVCLHRKSRVERVQRIKIVKNCCLQLMKLGIWS